MSLAGFTFDGNDLYCELASLARLAKQYDTPVYVYSKAGIQAQCRAIERTLNGVPHLTCYALKANSNPALLQLIKGEGIGAEVVSGGELYGALKHGFPPERIVFSGVGKRDEEIELALEKRIFALNVESFEELRTVSGLASRRGMKAPVFLRVNPEIEAGGHPYITTGRKHDKFGIEKQQAIEVFQWASTQQSLECLGLHVHIGSQVVGLKPYRAAADAIAALVGALKESGMGLRAVNMGGGFGVSYTDVVCDERLPANESREKVPTLEEYLKTVLPVYRSLGCMLLCEPGRAIVANSGALVVRVLYRKQAGDKRFVVVDGGMNDLIRPALYNAYHQIVPVRLIPGELEVVDVVGPICESGDFFALERPLPRVARRDYLAILSAGAYGWVFSSNYNGRPRAAEVLVDGAETSLIRKREAVEDLF